MKRLLILMLIVLTLILPLNGCGYNEDQLTEAKRIAYEEGYSVGYEEEKASIIQTPEGSILKDRIVEDPHDTYVTYEDEKTDNLTYQREWKYIKINLCVTVMNVGTDGAFTVHVKLEPREGYSSDRILPPHEQEIRIYLKTGEEKELCFDFYIAGGFYRQVWCTTP